MSTKHEIKTIDDLVRLVTPENKEEFIIGLTGLLEDTLMIKGKGEIGEVGFVWVDGGKKNVTTTIEVTE